MGGGNMLINLYLSSRAAGHPESERDTTPSHTVASRVNILTIRVEAYVRGSESDMRQAGEAHKRNCTKIAWIGK